MMLMHPPDYSGLLASRPMSPLARMMLGGQVPQTAAPPMDAGPALPAFNRQQALGSALQDAGLAMIQTAGAPRSWGQFAPSGLASIAAGIQAGRDSYQAAKASGQRSDAYSRAMGSGPANRQSLMRMFQTAAALGDTRTMQAVSEMLKSGAFGQSRFGFLDTDQGVAITNPETGEVTFAGQGQGGGAQRGRQLRTGVDERGQPAYYWVNPDGTKEKVEGLQPMVQRTEAQSKALALRQMLTPVSGPNSILDTLTPQQVPGVIDQVLSTAENPLAYSAVTDPTARRILLDGALYAEAFLRVTTGAAYNKQEFQNASRQFIPMPGDTAQLLQLKQERRANLLRVLDILGAPGGFTPSSDDERESIRQEVGADERSPTGASAGGRRRQPTVRYDSSGVPVF